MYLSFRMIFETDVYKNEESIKTCDQCDTRFGLDCARATGYTVDAIAMTLHLIYM